MGELTFEERFGELRSALARECGGAAFEEAIRHAVALMHQAPARFEEQVYPYALAGLERWYAAQPVGLDAGPLVVGRDRALSAITQHQPWLKVVRGLELAELRKERVFKELGRGRVPLERLEWLGLRHAEPPAGALARVMRLEVSPRLRALDVRVRGAGLEIAAWDPALLAQLEVLSVGSTREEEARLICGLEGLEQVALGGWIGGRGSWMEQARWARVRALRFEPGHQALDQAQLELLCGRGWPLEELVLGQAALSTAQKAAWVQRLGPLRRLEVRARGWYAAPRVGAQVAWPLEAVLSGELGGALESLSLSEVVAGQGAVCEGGERLRALSLSECEASGAACVAASAGRFGALERLEIRAARYEDGEALCAALSRAPRFARLHTARICWLTDGAQVEALARSEFLRGVRVLELGIRPEDALSVARALVEAEEALGELEALKVSILGYREVQQQAQGTWLAERLAYFLEM